MSAAQCVSSDWPIAVIAASFFAMLTVIVVAWIRAASR